MHVPTLRDWKLLAALHVFLLFPATKDQVSNNILGSLPARVTHCLSAEWGPWLFWVLHWLHNHLHQCFSKRGPQTSSVHWELVTRVNLGVLPKTYLLNEKLWRWPPADWTLASPAGGSDPRCTPTIAQSFNGNDLFSGQIYWEDACDILQGHFLGPGAALGPGEDGPCPLCTRDHKLYNKSSFMFLVCAERF